MPRTGDLTEWVTIQNVTYGHNTAGAKTETWATFAETKAKVETLSGSEYTTARQTGGTITYRLWIRFRSGVLPRMRVLWGDRTLEIVAAMEQKVRWEKWIVLECYEVI